MALSRPTGENHSIASIAVNPAKPHGAFASMPP